MKQALIDYIKRGTNDELYTPSYAIQPLLKYLPKENLTVWECTDFGGSNITKVLKDKGYNVISSHKTNFDFLNDTPDFDFDIIVTNPPYSLKDEFLEKCYEYHKPFCLLLPITALEGVTRGGMFRKNGVEVLVLDGRVNFMKKKGSWFNTSWFCYNVLPKQLVFEHLEKD